MEREFVEKESHFSFKDLFLYVLKRWYIAVAILILGIVGGIIVAVVTVRSSEFTMHQVSVQIVEFSTYARLRHEVLNEQDLGEVGNYNSFRDRSSRAIDAMRMATNVDEFLETASHRNLVSNLTPGDLRRYMINNITFTFTPAVFNVTYVHEGGFADYNHIVEFLDAYATFLLGRVHDTVHAFYNLAQAGHPGVSATPARRVATVPNETSALTHYSSRILLGLVAGCLVALLVLCTMYFLDPKVKSLAELERIGFTMLDTMHGDMFGLEYFKGLTASLANAKCVVLTESGGDKINAFTERLAKIYAEYTYKVLWIDANGVTGGKFKSFMLGESSADSISDGVDKVAFSSEGDWLLLSKSEERLNALKNKYDKIIFTVPNFSGSIYQACQQADVMVCIADKQLVKTKEARTVYECLDDTLTHKGMVVYNT